LFDYLKRPQNWPTLASDLDNLKLIAFEGAGVTGVMYTGAMKALEREGLLHSVERFAGTSSGSIVAIGAALGYRGDELVNIGVKQEFKAFCRTNGKWLFKKLFGNLRGEGVFSGDGITDWVRGLCARRIGNPELSFRDLQNYHRHAAEGDRTFFEQKYDEAMQHKDGYRKEFISRRFAFDFERGSREASVDAMMDIAKGFRLLEVGATEIINDTRGHRTEQGVLFSERDYPTMRVADAVRASAAYPYVFKLAKWKDPQGIIHRYTDGGFTIPIPLTSLDKPGVLNRHVLGFSSEFLGRPGGEPMRLGQGTQRILNMLAKQVGRNIRSEAGIEGDSLQIGQARMAADRARFHAMGEARDNDDDYRCRMAPIDRLGIDGTNFNITELQKYGLIENAYQTTLEAIHEWRRQKEQNHEQHGAGNHFTDRFPPRDSIKSAKQRRKDAPPPEHGK